MKVLWILGIGSLLVGCELKTPDPLDGDDTGRSLGLNTDSADGEGDTDGGDSSETGEEDTGPLQDPRCIVGGNELIFEDMALETTLAIRLTITNQCEGNCAVLEVAAGLTGDGFAMVSDPDEVLLLDGGRTGFVEVSYTATDYSAAKGVLTLYTNDPERQDIEIPLYGSTDGDQDGDGYGAIEAGGDDCDDLHAEVYPGGPELWDDLDNDCDGSAEVGLDEVTWAAVSGGPEESLSYLGNLGAGDLDGDGWAELLMGSDGGAVYVLDGDGEAAWVGGVDVAAAHIYQDSRTSLALGAVPPALGDHSGDGVVDLVVAGGTVGGSSKIAAAVLSGPLSAAALSDADAQLILGDTSWAGSAEVLSHLDMDGDGLAELVLGDADAGPSTAYYRGAVWLVNVGALAGADADLADADWAVHGESAADLLGGALGGGDADNDGYDDLFIGAAGADYNDPESGLFYMISGGGLPSGAGPVGDYSSLRLAGDEGDESMGYEAPPLVADFDGDGDNEIAVASPGNGDSPGLIDIHEITAGLSGVLGRSQALVTIDGAGAPRWFGLGLAAGDVDGDGAADLLVGAPDWDGDTAWDGIHQETSSGGALYLFGGAGLPYDGSTVGIGDADRALLSESQTDLFGQSLLAADLDGDGREDIAISATGWDGDVGYGHNGQVSLLLGR